MSSLSQECHDGETPTKLTYAVPDILSKSVEEWTARMLTPDPTLTTMKGYGQADWKS